MISPSVLSGGLPSPLDTQHSWVPLSVMLLRGLRKLNALAAYFSRPTTGNDGASVSMNERSYSAQCDRYANRLVTSPYSRRYRNWGTRTRIAQLLVRSYV